MTTIRYLLSKPTWSTTTLQSPTNSLPTIPPTAIPHLLRLSALPATTPSPTHLPTLTSHLNFVSAISKIPTVSVPPLTSLRHETTAALAGSTITLSKLGPHLATEKPFGYLKRMRREKTGHFDAKGKDILKKEEDWDKLGMAEETTAGYFVVKGAGDAAG